ncbi:MAG: hypothetical protein ACK4R2_03250 [Roseateles sp.]
MNLQDRLFSAVIAALAGLTFSVVAQAAPQHVVKLERVVITGKATRADAQVVTQLPRVTVVGYSDATLLRQMTLAAAKGATKRT